MSRAEILRHRPLRALLFAEVISTTGAQMTWLALPWFVLTTTGSAGQMTLVILAESIGFAAAGLPAGAFVERFGAQRSMLFADAVRAPLMLFVPILHWTGHLVDSRGSSCSRSCSALSARPYFTAQRVIMPELLGEDEAAMSQANALFQGAIRDDAAARAAAGRRAHRRDRRGERARHRRRDLPRVVRSSSCCSSRRGNAAPRPRSRPRSARRAQVPRPRAAAARLDPLFVAGDAAWQAFFVAVPVLTVERFGADAKIAGRALRRRSEQGR